MIDFDLLQCIRRLRIEAVMRGFHPPTTLLATHGVPRGHAVLLRKQPSTIRINARDARGLVSEQHPSAILGLTVEWAKA